MIPPIPVQRSVIHYDVGDDISPELVAAARRVVDASRAMADLERARAGLADFISRLTQKRSPVAVEVLAAADEDDWFGAIDRAQDVLMRVEQ